MNQSDIFGFCIRQLFDQSVVFQNNNSAVDYGYDNSTASG